MPDSPPLPDCTGVLVAGGRGVRLGGVAKGLLRVEGEPIAARTLRLFRRLFADALVSANDAAHYAALGAPIVADVIAGKGAPGGLHAALHAARTPWVFTAACDMPAVSEAGIRLLASRRAPGVAAVVPSWGGNLQVLHALWSRACLPALERMLREGDPSAQGIARALGATIVDEDAWRAIDPEGRAFDNANTPEDLVRLGLAGPASGG